MLAKDLMGMKPKQIEEKITNRVLVNFGYTILGYVILYAFYLYAMGRIGNILTYRYVMFGIFVALGILTAVLYVLSFSKSPKFEKYIPTFRNYAHMSLGVCLVSFYLNLPFYTRWMPVETAPAALRSVLMFIKNTRYEYYVVAVLMLAYLVFTIVYNNILIYKFTKKRKNNKTAKSK